MIIRKSAAGGELCGASACRAEPEDGGFPPENNGESFGALYALLPTARRPFLRGAGISEKEPFPHADSCRQRYKGTAYGKGIAGNGSGSRLYRFSEKEVPKGAVGWHAVRFPRAFGMIILILRFFATANYSAARKRKNERSAGKTARQSKALPICISGIMLYMITMGLAYFAVWKKSLSRACRRII